MRRRRALAVLGAAALGLAGCTDPAIHGSPGSPSPRPTPVGSPGPDPLLVAASLELALAEQARTLGRVVSDKDQRTRCDRLAAVHTAHAEALTGPHPASRASAPPTPRASAAPTALPPLGQDRAKALTRLDDQEDAAAKSYRARVTDGGEDALLWAALAVSAAIAGDAVAATSTPPAAPTTATAPVPTASPASAAQPLLRQVHAVRYAYRQAIAALGGSSRERARAELADRTRLRDELVALLREAKEDVPAAEPAYTVPVRPDTAARAAQLLRTVDVALLPFLGQWLAMDAAHRSAALEALGRSAASSVHWGGGPLAWPGYP